MTLGERREFWGKFLFCWGKPEELGWGGGGVSLQAGVLGGPALTQGALTPGGHRAGGAAPEPGLWPCIVPRRPPCPGDRVVVGAIIHATRAWGRGGRGAGLRD